VVVVGAILASGRLAAEVALKEFAASFVPALLAVLLPRFSVVHAGVVASGAVLAVGPGALRAESVVVKLVG